MKNLYVGNLPHSTTEMDLRNAFAVYGQVDSVNIITENAEEQAASFQVGADHHKRSQELSSEEKYN